MDRLWRSPILLALLVSGCTTCKPEYVVCQEKFPIGVVGKGSYEYPLKMGVNKVIIEATDNAGNVATKTVCIERVKCQ